MIKKIRPAMNKPLFSTLFSLLMILSLVAPQPLIQATHAATGGDTLKANPRRSTTAQGIARQEFPVAAEPDSQQGLQIVLGEGAEQPNASEQLPVAETTPLDAAQTQQIIDRLPALETEPQDVQEFRLPVESLPPPRTGETITETFPPQQDEASAPEVESGPLQVLRYAPEGEIPLAPFLNVTFNQPMAPLSTLQQLAAQDVPVKITPEVPGVWKWLGTRTLSFEYASDEFDRFPMSTEFTVEIPAGTESITGGVLEEAVTWTFRTPAPTVQSYYPNSSPQPRDPLFYVQFDQRIDPEAVLETVNVRAQGQRYPVRPATEDEIAADARVQKLSESAPESRWLAFRAEQQLPADSTIAVDIGPGTPSAEGPLTTEKVQSFSFQTYGPLRVIEHRCGYGQCPPFSPFIIRFNNPLDQEAFDEAWITMDPELPGAVINNLGDTLQIQGSTQGRTTYKVTLAADLRDIFGQTLAEEQTLEFQVGSAVPMLSGPSDLTITLDPSSAPVFTVYSINYTSLRYRVFAVQPEDWPAYQQYRDNFWRNVTPPDPPGQLLEENFIEIDAQPDELVETPMALTKMLPNGLGHLIVVVDIPLRLNLKGEDTRNQTVQTWVQVTQMGLDAFVDHSEMTAWANDLRTGAPLADVELSLLNSQAAAVTGADGTAKIELPSQSSPLLVARQGDDAAILPQSSYSGGGWQRMPVQDELAWYVWDDRQMYRPGEEVHVKGWVRRIGGKQDGDVSLLGGQGALNYIVSGPQGNQLTTGSAELNAAGGFDLAFTLPENANLGYANLQLTLAGSVSNLNSRDYWHSFQIQEFRRPEFEVTAGNESTGPFFVGGQAVTFVRAAYFAGGPLPNAETFWNVSATPTNYAPPNWPGFIFGSWTPWWGYSDLYFGGPDGGSSYVSYNSRTDAAGAHYLQMEFTGADEPRPYSVQADVSVMDVNRQSWAAATTLLVHPADIYVGLRSERTFVERGAPLEVEAVAVDIDGNAISGRTINVRAARLEWKYKNGQWNEEEADVQECTLTSSAFPSESPTVCTFATEQGGTYRITATVEDEQGRLNQTVMTRWVSGGKRPPARQVEREEATLIPDKEEYQPGDSAEILVQAPFAPAEGLLTVSRNGILYTERFQMESESTIIRVPIEERHIPNLYVQVDLVGAAPRLDDQGEAAPDLPARPAYASGSLSLSVPPLARTLALEVTPAETALSPGAQTTLDLALTDAAGAPVADAEVAVIVVDEAILALTGYQLTDPVALFYGTRGSYISDYHSRSSIVLANPLALAQQVAEEQETAMFSRSAMPTAAAAPQAAPMAAADSADESFAVAAEMGVGGGADGNANVAQPPITLRTNFNPLALFAPSVTTDAQGHAQVDVQLPDNLTRYRIMAVAVAGENNFGSAEANLTARLPLMVRPSAPRFLNFGDRFELPIVLQNQTDEEMQVNVAVQAANIDLTDVTQNEVAQNEGASDNSQPESAGQTVTVPANDRVEVRFPAAAMSAGTARFQIAAVSGSDTDAATVELPVYTPATTEAFAVYGVVDEGAVIQPVAKPTDVFPQFGGLEIQTSSTALQALTDALLYLTAYPYDCSEQLASRIMAIATLRDVLTAFDAAGLPSSDEMMAAVERDAKTLQSLQNFDGGWPVWTRGRESIPYYSIFVAHALQVARDKGFPVTEETRQMSLQYLRQIEQYYPSWYGQQTRWALSAYALNVRNLMGDVDGPKARALFAESGVDRMPLEGLAWLLPLLAADPSAATEADAIRQHFNNRAVETAGAANFTTSYGDDEYVMLHSNRRTDGVILDALIADQPTSDLIPKVVNGLLAHRTRGRWGNTQENAFILLALDHYFNTFEAQTPDFVANIWLGETYAGGHEFVGRTTERHETQVPMRYLVDQQAADMQDLIVSKEGDGRLYYRLGLRYAPTDLEMPPLDMGFVVQREYEAVDDPQDVSRDEDGTWRMRAGARVRVRISMVADSRRYHVALVDPLPAGLEIINPALAVSENIPADPGDASGRSWWWWGTWYQHQNLRDQRAEAFTTLLWDGVYTYSYVARATTPGQFVVPPAKAEEMYSPEVFGRSAVDKVIVN